MQADMFARACQLDHAGQTEAARDAYLAVLAHDPTHAGALANLGALLFAAGYTSAARITYSQAAAAHPDDPACHVRLANLLRLDNQPAAATHHYQAALRLDALCPEAHQGLSYLLADIDEPAAQHHRKLGFTHRALTTARYRGTGRPIEVLQLVSARGGNIPTGRILSDLLCRTHTMVAEFADPATPLPPHDLVFNAIGDADRCADALQAAETLLARATRPVINPPRHIRPTTRRETASRLRHLTDIVVPKMGLLPRAGLPHAAAHLPLPFLLRSPGFHTGQHFRRIDHFGQLGEAAAALPGDTLLHIEYLNAAGADGAFRKYRVMFIGPHILPLHLAISADWKVHYFTADMAANASHRDEEARFLADMAGTLGPRAMAALATIRDTLGLDYAGVDFAIAADGKLMLFEANATMTLVQVPTGAIWDYRRPAVERAFAAAQALIQSKAGQEGRVLF